MALPFVFCDSGIVEASIVPDTLLGKPGECPPGIYETLLIEGGRFRDFNEHYERFSKSCEKFKLSYPQVTDRELLELAEKCDGGERMRCRLMAFSDKQELRSGLTTRFLAALWAAPSVLSNRGIDVACWKSGRVPGDPMFIHKRLGQREVEQQLAMEAKRGISDLLVLNREGDLCEGVYSNLVVVKNGIIYSPPEDAPCLPGITLKRVLEAATRLGIEVRRESIPDVCAAEEIWLTSSIRGLQWVSRVSRNEIDEAGESGRQYWESPDVAPEGSVYQVAGQGLFQV